MTFSLKLCYGLIVSGKVNQVKNLINILNVGENIIIVHCDLGNESLYQELYGLYKNDKHVFFAAQRYRGGWGEVTLMHIELQLLRDSLFHDYDYFTLLSESCLPVKTDEYIKNFLFTHRGTEFIECFLQPLMRYRIHLSHAMPVTEFQRKYRNVVSFFNIVRDFVGGPFIGQKEYRSYKIYTGTQWFTITKDFARFADHYADEHRFKEKYQHSLMCDELFMQDILSHSDFKNRLYRHGKRTAATVYINWKVLHAPKILTEKDLRHLEKSDILYARKFDENKDISVMNSIYSMRHSEKTGQFSDSD